jgi:hypothetical protein
VFNNYEIMQGTICSLTVPPGFLLRKITNHKERKDCVSELAKPGVSERERLAE